MKFSLLSAMVGVSYVVCMAGLASASLSWESCGQAEDLLDIRSIQYTPDNPQRGDVLNVTAFGLLKEPLDMGTKINLLVKWGYVRGGSLGCVVSGVVHSLFVCVCVCVSLSLSLSLPPPPTISHDPLL